MTNSNVILNALPSFWKDRFEDIGLLESMYDYLGNYLGGVYEDASAQLSKLSLTGTPIHDYRSWNILPLSTIHRLSVTSTNAEGNSFVIYGLREQEYIINTCYRIYSSPDLGSKYIDNNYFSFYNKESKEISDLIQLTNNTAFFNRFNRFIVFTNTDPITSLESQEPEEVTAFYPLGFRVNNYLLGNLTEQQILSKRVTLKFSDEYVTTDILAIEKEIESTLLLVDPDAFTPFVDDSTVTIEGLTSTSITASVYTSYSQLVTNINIWAYDCEIDNLELFRRWGFLLTPDFVQKRPIRSSELYKNLLEEMLEARLRGLSSLRLENIASLLAGSDRIVFNTLTDTILTIDLVDNIIVSQLTNYSLLPGQAIHPAIVKATSQIKTSSGIHVRSSCTMLEILDNSVYNLLISSYNTYGPKKVKVYNSTNQLIGDIILVCTGSSIVVTTEGTYELLGSDLRIYYLQNEYVSLAASKYSVISLQEVGKLSSGELVNPQATVFDISTGIASRVQQGLFLPKDIWEVDEAYRREITTNLTSHVIGAMPTYRIGDYELYIPDPTNLSIFDSISQDNPQGLAWPTSYKLFNNFLINKLAILSPTNITTVSNLDACIKTISSVKDAAKRIVVVNDTPLVNFVPLPSENLEVVVNSPNIGDTFITQSYEGINSLNPTLLINGNFQINNSSSVTRIQFTTSNVTADVVLKGGYGDYALVEVSSNFTDVYTALQQEQPIALEVGSVFIVANRIELATNYIGSESRLMVVGASYPEYTHYYDFDPNITSEWLQIQVTPPPPPSELSEEPIQVSANLEQPQVLIPVTQNLDDNIESPSDNLPDPEEI